MTYCWGSFGGMLEGHLEPLEEHLEPGGSRGQCRLQENDALWFLSFIMSWLTWWVCGGDLFCPSHISKDPIALLYPELGPFHSKLLKSSPRIVRRPGTEPNLSFKPMPEPVLYMQLRWCSRELRLYWSSATGPKKHAWWIDCAMGSKSIR